MLTLKYDFFNKLKNYDENQNVRLKIEDVVFLIELRNLHSKFQSKYSKINQSS